MKKIVKASLLLAAAASLGVMNVNAKVMKAADIEKALTDSNGDSEVAYIFGKHVYVNRYTMADAVDAANTLNGQTDAILVLKNGENKWSNAISGAEIKNFEMEMTKLVGEPTEDGFVSYDSNLNKDGSYVEQVKRPNSSIVEDIFLDETSPIQITGVRALQKVVKLEDGTTYANAIHEYNTGAMKVSFSNGTLTLTEQTPLVEYYNKETADEAKWFGLLIKTNKAVEDGITLTVAGSDVTSDVVAGTVHGGDKSEVMVWVNTETFSDNPIITISDEEGNETEVKVKYVALEHSYQAEVEAEDTIAIDTKKSPKAKSLVLTAGESTIALFYSNDEDEATIYFTQNGDNKCIKIDNNIESLITVKNTSFAKKTANDKYLTVSAPVAGEGKTEDGKNINYVVTLTTTRDLTDADGSKKVPVKIDLGVALKDLSEDSTTTTVTTDYTKDVVFAKDSKETIVTLTNDTEDLEDEIIVKFVLVENIPAFELKSAKLIKSVDHIDSELEDTNSWGAVDAVIKSNLSRLNTATISADTETKLKDTIKIQAKNVLENLKNAVEPYAESSKLYALVIDFGVDRSAIRLPEGANVRALGIGAATSDKNPAKLDLSAYGATGTAFVVILDADTTELTFTNADTNKKITVKINLTEVVECTDTTELTSANKVTIVDEYQSSVSYVKTNTFKVNEDVKDFKAMIDGKEYSYTCDIEEKTCTRAEALTIKSVRPVSDTLVTGFVAKASAYNQKSVTAKASGKDAIAVTINRDMNPAVELNAGTKDWVALLVEFDQDISSKSLSVNSAEVTISNNLQFATGIQKLLTAEEAKNANHYAVIWVHSADKAQEFAIVENGVDHLMTVTTIKVANATDLKVNSVANVATGTGNDVLNKTLADVKDDVLYNLAGVKKIEKVDNNTIRVTVDKSMAKNAEGFKSVNLSAMSDSAVTTGKYIVFRANLNNKTKLDKIQADYKDKFDAKANETLIWVNLADATKDACDTTKADNKYCVVAEFENADENNQYNTANIKIEIVDESKDMTVVSAKKVSSSNVPSSIKGDNYITSFKNNQDKFGVTFKKVDNVNKLTINTLKAGNEALPYVIDQDRNQKWFVVDIDFGTTLVSYEDFSKLPDTTDNGTGLYYELKSGTTYTLWIMLDYTKLVTETGKTVTFKSSYDESKTIDLVIKTDLENVAK